MEKHETRRPLRPYFLLKLGKLRSGAVGQQSRGAARSLRASSQPRSRRRMRDGRPGRATDTRCIEHLPAAGAEVVHREGEAAPAHRAPAARSIDVGPGVGRSGRPATSVHRHLWKLWIESGIVRRDAVDAQGRCGCHGERTAWGARQHRRGGGCAPVGVPCSPPATRPRPAGHLTAGIRACILRRPLDAGLTNRSIGGDACGCGPRPYVDK